jgi:hypothetical protein
MKRLLACAFAATSLFLFASVPAGAATRVGPDTSVSPSGLTGCGGAACTLVFEAATPGFSYAIPADGVLTRWSIQTGPGPAPAPWRVRTAGKSGSDWFGIRSASFESVPANSLRTFPTRIPAAAGQTIALDGPQSSGMALPTTPAPASFHQLQPPLVDGGSPQTPVGNGGVGDGLFSADLEADADRDAFGDESQDACPADAARHQTCVTFQKKPKHKVRTPKKKSRAKFTFTAGAPTLECSFDKGAFTPCVSPLTRKVRRGRHTLQVRAVNASGYIDPAPATYSWKVKRKK